MYYMGYSILGGLLGEVNTKPFLTYILCYVGYQVKGYYYVGSIIGKILLVLGVVWI